jgi:N-formylglutamate deformylase
VNARPDWLHVRRKEAPLILSMPHSGTQLVPEIEPDLVSAWLARRDADWWVDHLYDFGAELGATIVQTNLSRTVIDVNRDPSGRSLYPGQATTELCPTTTFDGDALYRAGRAPDATAIAVRRERYFAPYHAALAAEITRLRERHPAVVVYDCHSIRSRVPRLFEGDLPHFNIGTNSGASCAPELTAAVEAACATGNFTRVTNGRWKGGYITRQYGVPAQGVHAVQMELACRGYLKEQPGAISPENWPVPYEEAYAAPIRRVLRRVLEACLEFAAVRR